jgi:hypothetical protein
MLPAPESPGPKILARCGPIGLVLLLLCGCREAPAPAVAEDAAAREKAAAALYKRAQGAVVPEKFEILRRVIGVYGDTTLGRDTYLELVVLLLHDEPPRTAEALVVARKFRDRYPKDPRVGECYRHVADIAYATKEEATKTAALDDWFNHLAALDVGDQVPKASVRVDFVRVLLRQERWKEAEVAIDTALAEPDLQHADRVELYVRKGNLLADKLSDRPGAKAAFEKGLELARQAAKAQMPQPGIPPDQIEAEIKKLDAK